jgi:hypothetical protein
MDEELKKILEENLRINQENNRMLHSIKRHFVWQRIVAIFYFIIIVGPIVWGIFYLPALLKPIISQYQDLLGSPNTSGSINLQDIQNIQKSITPEMLKKLQTGK